MRDGKKSDLVRGARCRVLSAGPLGRVSVCPAGCFHIDTGFMSLRLSKAQYLTLVEMLSRAADELDATSDAVVH